VSALEAMQQRYRDLRKIGEGGMGEVWYGVDRMLEREVALKLLLPELKVKPDSAARLRNEAISMARINHPNIVTVYEFAQVGDDSWITMEYVPGDTLDILLAREGKLPWTDAIDLVTQALLGLERAHAAGIVHRDLKPANIFVTDEKLVKLVDFGIARISQSARLTQQGFGVGTPEYMAPEQALGKEPDARTDLYTLGIIFYEAVTGQLPFAGTEYEIVKQQVETPAPSIGKLVPDLPSALQAIVAKVLAKAPDKRPASARELRLALQAVPRPQPSVRSPKRRESRWMIGVAAGLALVALIGIGTAWSLRAPSIPAAAPAISPASTPPGRDIASIVTNKPVERQPEARPTDQKPGENAHTAPSAETPVVPSTVDADLTATLQRCNALVAQARTALRSGKPTQAIELARRAQKDFSLCDGSDQVLADARQAESRIEEAQRKASAKSVAQSTPAKSTPTVAAGRGACQALVKLGNDNLSNSQYSAARQAAESALNEDPSCPGAQDLIARTQRARLEAQQQQVIR